MTRLLEALPTALGARQVARGPALASPLEATLMLVACVCYLSLSMAKHGVWGVR